MRATTISWTLESDSKQRAFNQSTQSISACVRMYLWTRACRHSTCAAQHMRRAHALNTTPQLSAYKSSMFPAEFFIRKKKVWTNWPIVHGLPVSRTNSEIWRDSPENCHLRQSSFFSSRPLVTPPPIPSRPPSTVPADSSSSPFSRTVTLVTV